MPFQARTLDVHLLCDFADSAQETEPSIVSSVWGGRFCGGTVRTRDVLPCRHDELQLRAALRRVRRTAVARASRSM
jgi:hypothetical protein